VCALAAMRTQVRSGESRCGHNAAEVIGMRWRKGKKPVEGAGTSMDASREEEFHRHPAAGSNMALR